MALSYISFSPPPSTLNYWEELSHYYRHRGLNHSTSFADDSVLRSIKTGVYYVALSPDQQAVWDALHTSDIDALQNTTSEKNAYSAAVNDPTPDENVLL
ncbi:MAG: hypothetical protein MUO77_12090, partial [Anaerolineales bacterium]|nr:hypothetical protein [Anaerolineales bacterium]